MLRGEEVGNWVVGDDEEVVVVLVLAVAVDEAGAGFARAECAWKAARRFVRKGLLLVVGRVGMVVVVGGRGSGFFFFLGGGG